MPLPGLLLGRAALQFLASALVLGVGAARGEALSRADYLAHKRQIEADYRADQSGCQRRTGQDRSLCTAQAKGRLKVALAELDFNASGKDADAARLAAAKSESDYNVARQRCEAVQPRADRERCLGQAEAAHAKALAGMRATPLRKY